MKKLYILFVFAFLIVSCKDKKNNNLTESDLYTPDSLSVYLSYSDKDNIEDNQKKVYFNKAYHILLNQKNDSLNRDNLAKLLVAYYKILDQKGFNTTANFLFDNATLSKDSLNLAKLYRYKGNFLRKRAVFDSSFYYYIKSEKLYKKLKDDVNLGNVLINKSIVQFNVNDYLGADKTISQAYIYLKDTSDKQKIFEVFTIMGVISNELKDYNRSIEYNDKALRIVRENKLNNSEHQEATCLNNIGYAYQNSGDYKAAIKNYKSALDDPKLPDDSPELYALLIDNLAYSKFKIHQTDDLPELFYKSLKIREKLNATTVIVLSKIHLSEYYSEMNDSLLSKKFAVEALQLAKKSKIPRDILASLKQASNVDRIEAPRYSKDYIRINDSLQDVESKSKDRFARLMLETDEIIQEKDKLEEKNRDILNYFIGTVIFGMFLFFARAQRTKNRELVLKQAQQQANEDIYKLIISQQNKLEEGRVLEKNRIAKEIHDGILGRLFGVRLSLDGLNFRTDVEAVAERLSYLNELKLIEQDLRDVSHELSREKFVLINNFVAIINNLLDEQIKINPASLAIKIGEDINWNLLSNTTKINLYRILQESLQNINKYANANSLSVEFRKDKKGNLVLQIEDDGDGFDSDKKSKGIGLQNIVERTHESEGTIDIKAAKGKGVQITVTVPLQNKTIKI
ncbi:tetratricopeptide repeat protein [Flavobacterium sp. SUN046]|uniref:ATP-binding protein n=1 Tax=Flavobacterium sp. SUN046 TaxID=3002440 RepID=UPI002DBA2509|nr:tetratricopeptide repeat protein [Flavobacterium sp. SUN046]MEC4047993.1 tetratricopeptide repeat protein [Flavobacterium sp. SUN046]